jgi:hypothetical protein
VSTDGGGVGLGRYAGWMAAGSVVALAVAALVPEDATSRWAALEGVGLAVGTGVLALALKQRALGRGGLNAALKAVAMVFGLRAVGVGVGLAWWVRRDVGAMAFVAGFFATYFVLQWIELSYVMAASKGAAGGDE